MLTRLLTVLLLFGSLSAFAQEKTVTTAELAWCHDGYKCSPMMAPASPDASRGYAWAMQPAPAAVPVVGSTAVVAQPAPQRNWSAIEIVLTAGVLVFALAVLGMVMWLACSALKAGKAWSPQSVLRVFGIVLILCFAVVLVAAGYDERQIAPVMGLLGVVAGYLLGNGEKSKPQGSTSSSD
jgi:hypothetical protein